MRRLIVMDLHFFVTYVDVKMRKYPVPMNIYTIDDLMQNNLYVNKFSSLNNFILDSISKALTKFSLHALLLNLFI